MKNSRAVKRRPNIVQLGKAMLRVEQDTKLFYLVLLILMDQG